MPRALLCGLGICLLSVSAFAEDDLSTAKGFEQAFRPANATCDMRKLERFVFWENSREQSEHNLRYRLKEGVGHKPFFAKTLRRLGITSSFLHDHGVKLLVHINPKLNHPSAAIKLAAGSLV